MVGEQERPHRRARDGLGGLPQLAAYACGVLVPLVALPVHMWLLKHFWRGYHRHVDRQFCTCSCWDTIFKGSYETGIASYKHLYFNATANSMKMWAWTVVWLVALYETVRHLACLAFQRQLRYSMLLLFASVFYSHYYTWWGYLNYWNDEFYDQWYHQLFYTVTELLSTLLVLQLADARQPVTLRRSLGVASIGLMHVAGAGWDNFYTNVIRGHGYSHQVVRDLGLMLPDLLHVVLPLVLVRDHLRLRHCDAGLRRELRQELLAAVALVATGLLVCSYL